MFNWYRIFNHQDFLDLDVPSAQVDVVLEGQGTKTLLVTKGIGTSIHVDEVVLTINLNSKNPFRYDTRAVFLDDHGDVWLGVYVDD